MLLTGCQIVLCWEERGEGSKALVSWEQVRVTRRGKAHGKEVVFCHSFASVRSWEGAAEGAWALIFGLRTFRSFYNLFVLFLFGQASADAINLLAMIYEQLFLWWCLFFTGLLWRLGFLLKKKSFQWMDSTVAGRETPAFTRHLNSCCNTFLLGYPDQPASPSLSQILSQSVRPSVIHPVREAHSQTVGQTVRQIRRYT